MINEFEKDLEQAAKTASEWLTAETKRILQEKGRFKSTEHTRSIYSIMAEELDKMGYCKKRAEIERLNMAVDMLDHETAIKEECIQRLEREKQSLTEKIVKEAVTKILGFCADDEVGMKYLIKRTAKEYGVEL